MRCPVCNADVLQGRKCRRCRADLGLLFELAEDREALLNAARRRLAQGRWQEAARLAHQADELHGGEDSAGTRAAARLLAGDFPAAWAAYVAARRNASAGEPG
jgi:hypothetical protein